MSHEQELSDLRAHLAETAKAARALAYIAMESVEYSDWPELQSALIQAPAFPLTRTLSGQCARTPTAAVVTPFVA